MTETLGRTTVHAVAPWVRNRRRRRHPHMRIWEPTLYSFRSARITRPKNIKHNLNYSFHTTVLCKCEDHQAYKLFYFYSIDSENEFHHHSSKRNYTNNRNFHYTLKWDIITKKDSSKYDCSSSSISTCIRARCQFRKKKCIWITWNGPDQWSCALEKKMRNRAMLEKRKKEKIRYIWTFKYL